MLIGVTQPVIVTVVQTLTVYFCPGATVPDGENVTDTEPFTVPYAATMLVGAMSCTVADVDDTALVADAYPGVDETAMVST